MKLIPILSALLLAIWSGDLVLGHGIGRPQPGQELLWVSTKFTQVYEEVQDEILLDFKYDGKDEIKYITYTWFDTDYVRIQTQLNFI